MNIFHLPPALAVALFAGPVFSANTHTPFFNNTTDVNDTVAIPANGTGPAYASACSAAVIAYYSRSSAWNLNHSYISTTTSTLGGLTESRITYFENATTLCDGYPRVAYSPAISLSDGWATTSAPVTGTTTILGTYFKNYPFSAPSCSIQPSDCDPLWSQYSASKTEASTITPAPSLAEPPCVGVKEAASLSSLSAKIYGCGPCTIYGDTVQLVFFPTTASRDMCASTPTASLTHYGTNAVITAFSGKNFTGGGDANGNQTVVADGHTFTSGTAYISIATVYAVDRCSNTFGSPVNDAILAMPSESVLSLRYSQDHFQRIMETNRVTGYPVSYADFNSPVPWSAWNGQNWCDPGGYGGWACSVIYQDSYRPQLAIPPQITELSPDFQGCQMWYNGLYDPPLALQPAASVATPTLPVKYSPSSPASSAAPSSTAASPTVKPTALPNGLPTTTPGSPNTAAPTLSNPTTSYSPQHPNPYRPDSEPWVQSFDVNGRILWATGANHQARIDTSVTCTSGGPTKTLADGTQVSYGDDGLILKGVSTVVFGEDSTPTQSSNNGELQTPVATYILSGLHITAARSTAFVEIDGQTKIAVQSSHGGPVVFDGSTTLSPGGPATTLPNGEVLSAADDGLILDWTSTVGVTEVTGSRGSAPNETGASDQHSTKTASSSVTSHTSTDSPQKTSSAGRSDKFTPITAIFVAAIGIWTTLGT